MKEKLPKPEWGAIDRLPSGRVRLRGPIDGERTTIGSYATIEEALGVALETKRKLDGAPRGMSVGGWIEKWCNAREKARRHRSIDDTRGLFARYVEKERIAKRLLRELRTKHVAQWLNELAQRTGPTGAPLARSTLRNALTALSVALRDAVLAGHLDANPAFGVVLPPRPARTDDDWTFLSAKEIGELLGHEALVGKNGDRARRIFTIAIFTGLREGELWGLRWPDVELGDEDPHVVVRYGNAAGGPTKSGKPRRVPLLPPARAAFKELRELGGVRRGLGHVFWGKCGLHSEGYDAEWAGSWHRPKRVGGQDVEPGPDGKPPRVFRDGWRERCGMRSEVRFHDFRHTFASHLIMGTWGRAWRLEEVQVLLGHTSITTTQRYAHLAPEGLARSVADAERMWLDPQVTPRVTGSVIPFPQKAKKQSDSK